MSNLVAIPFTPDDLFRVKDFACGDLPFQKQLADWIREESLGCLKRKGKVWLYANESRELVGFGSLGESSWEYPEPESPKERLIVIPAVAIQEPHWGKPEGPVSERYSSQIMTHLLKQAKTWPKPLGLLGLFVHPDNSGALKVYERYGFTPYSRTFTDPADGAVYRSLIRPIDRS